MSPFTLVIPYRDPDLDGTASAVAYAEYLQKTGRPARAGVLRSPGKEANYVLDKVEVELHDAEDVEEQAAEVVLVDDSSIRALNNQIDPARVVEIIDHRKEYNLEEFPNVEKVQIELVGAAATLIAEKFYENNLDVSQDSALLLYAAIISNTLNFQASVTTERDRKMVEWLKDQISIEEGFVRKMFEHKSEILEPLKQVFIQDWKNRTMGEKTVGMAQMEIVDVDEFVSERREEIISALKEIKNEENLDLVFLTCADLEEGFNIYLTIDQETEKLLSEALDIEFEDGKAVRDDMLLRKEIEPKLKEVIKHCE